MLPDIAAFLNLGANQVAMFFSVFLRVGAAMALMPGFGEQVVPMRVKLVLGLAFSAIVWPMVGQYSSLDVNGLTALTFVSEAITGLALGAFFRLFVIVLQLAGMMAAQSTSLSQLFEGPATPEPTPAFGNILVIGGLALAMISGLHVKIAIALSQSYAVVPLGVFPSPADLTGWGIDRISSAFGMAFSLAAPFIVVSAIYNLALGAINRAMPQLMVALVGAPAITFGGLLLLAITSPVILSIWLERLNAGLAFPFGGGF